MKIFAHRGNSGEAPENTMAAFRQAIEAGAAGVELDVQAGRDGLPVVIHDEFLGRTVAGEGWVGERTLAELKGMDAGTWFDARFAGETVPALTEVLELLRPTGLLLNIEFKTGRFPYPGLVPKVLELVAQAGMNERVILSSFNHHTLAEAKTLAPRLECAVLMESHLIKPWEYTTGNGFQALHPVKYACTEELVGESRVRGLAVRPYTANDRETAFSLFALAVDGIFTNHPRLMVEWWEAWQASTFAPLKTRD